MSSHGRSAEEHAKDGEKVIRSEKPVGFWASSLKSKSFKIIQQCSWINLALSIYVFGVVSLFCAILHGVESNLGSLGVHVVNFETGEAALIGPLVVQTAEQIAANSSAPHIGYVTVPPSFYQGGYSALLRSVYEEKVWATVTIKENATQELRQAAEQGDSTYNPSSACQIIYLEARDQNTYRDFILPQLAELQAKVVSAFMERWIDHIMSNTSMVRNVAEAPQVLYPAISFSEVNLRPFGPPIAQAYVSFALVFLVIASFFCVRFYQPINMRFLDSTGGYPPLKFYHLVIWRWTASISSYLCISLAYSLVCLVLHPSFFGPATRSSGLVSEVSNKFGTATFPIYWLIIFLGLTALGLACENVLMLIDLPWAQLWLIFWVVTNGSTVFFSLELSPGFYKWGYAWPLYNMSSAIRTIFFDLHSNLAINFAALLGWIGLSTFLYPLCCIYFRWKINRVKNLI